MDIEMVTRTIGAIVAPVVMVTACSLVLNGLLARYAAINDRMRAMGRERFEVVGTLHVATPDSFTLERLLEIDTQIPDLLGRHRMMRDAVVAVYSALFLFVGSMVIIAAAALLRSSPLATAALVVFLAGTAVLLSGVLVAIVEVRGSDRAIHYEMERVLRVGK